MCAPYETLPSPEFEIPARFVGKYLTRKWREDGGTRQVERSIDRTREWKPGGAYVKRGGQRDRRHLFWFKRSEGGTPRAIVRQTT